VLSLWGFGGVCGEARELTGGGGGAGGRGGERAVVGIGDSECGMGGCGAAGEEGASVVVCASDECVDGLHCQSLREEIGRDDQVRCRIRDGFRIPGEVFS